MSQPPPAQPPRRAVPRVFRRQNSFAGFPSATLSIFNNNNNNNNNNSGRNSGKTGLPPASTGAEVTSAGYTPPSGIPTTAGGTTPGAIAFGAPSAGLPTCGASHVAAPPTSAHASLPVYQPPPAASRPVSGFYSLPRHNRPGHLSRALGVGFHLLARTTPPGSSGPTAAEQLGINSPALPKSHRRNLSEGNTGETITSLPITYGSLSRSKGGTKDAVPQTTSSGGGEAKVKSSTKRRDGESKPRRRDPDYQSLPRRPSKDQTSKRSPKDGDSKNQSSAKRHDTEPKFRSLPRRHEGEARYQAVSRKSEGDPKYQSLPKRHSTEPRYQTFPKRRDGESSSHHPSSPKRRSTDSSHQSSSPKRRDVGAGALPSSPKKRDMGPGHPPASPKKRDPEGGFYQSLSPKRRSTADSKYQQPPPPPPKQFDIAPKDEMFLPKRPEVDLKYQTFPQKRHDTDSRYHHTVPPPKAYDIDTKYQVPPPKREELDLRYFPLPPPRYDTEAKYQTVPPKRRDMDQRYPSVPPKKFGIDLKYQPLPPPKRYDTGPRYQTIPPKRHDADHHRYHYIPPPRPDIEPRYQQPPPRRFDIDPKYQQLPPRRPDIEPKYQQLPPRRPDIEPKYQQLPPRRPDIEPRYQQQLPPRPDIEPKYQPLPPRPDIEPKYTQLPPRRPEPDPRYQPLPPRPDIEPRYQQLPPRPDIEPKYQPLPPRPDIEPKYQPPPPRPDIEPKYQPLPPRPDIEPKYQPLPPRPDIEPKYQQLPPRRPDGECKYQPPPPPRHPNGEARYHPSPPEADMVYPPRRPDIEPKYQPLPPRPDIEPKYQQLPPRRPDGEGKYQPLPPRRPEVEANYQPLPPRRPEMEANYQPLPPRRPEIEASYQALPPRRPEVEASYQALPPRRPEVEPKYQPLPPRRPELESKYQPLPPRRPEAEANYQPLPPRRPELEAKYQPLPPRRPELEAKYQPLPPRRPEVEAKYQPLPPRRPDGEGKYQPQPPRGSDYEFQPIPTIKPETESAFQPQPPMFDYEFQPIPTIKPNYEQTYPSMPLRKPDGESHPLPPVSGDGHHVIQSQPKLQTLPARTHGPDAPYQTAPPVPRTTDHLPQSIPTKVYHSDPLHQPQVPKVVGNIPLYESIPAKLTGSEPVTAKVPGVIPLYEGIPPKIKMPEAPFQSIPPKVSESEPLYQTMPSPMSPLKADEAEPLYQSSPPKMSAGEPLYQSSPDALESDPVYQAVTPQMIQDVKSNYQLLQQRKLEQEAKALAGPKRPIKGDKYHSPTKRTFRERDSESKSQSSSKKSSKGEPKYQSLPKRRERENDGKYQSLPRRGARRDPPAPPQFRWTPGDDDGIYSSLEYPSEEGRSGGPSEDEIYSSLTTTDDPVYQSVSEASYSRPVPPLPAPLRYRRRVDDAPPPLPPPRLTTGPVGSHNPLLSPGTVVSPPVLPARTPRVSSASNQRLSYPGGSSTSPSPSPENLLTQSAPPWPRQHRTDNEEVYSSIPSLISSTPESPPATLPRAAQIGRVAPSASWNSLGSSCRSSWDSLGSSVRSESSNNVRQRRRRARSDPRMDAGVLHRLAFTIWHTALHIEKENNNDAAVSQKQPTISSRNTQSAARLTRVMAGSGGGGGVGGEGSGAAAAAAGGGGPKMDVVYVTERIISLAFPPTLDDATYTLHLREVAHMLSSKHGDNFKVFNLSGQGEVSHFLPRVLELGWADQLAPALERLCSICKALDSWITQHPQHVAVLHARGGYEKLGVVVAAYMHYSNICASTDQALDRYAMKRFFDDKIGQLYHPSQKRYVQYFAGLLSGVIRINSSPLYLHTLTMYGVPHFEPRGGCHLFIKIYQGMTPIYTSGIYNLTETMRQVTIVFETGVQLRGDILLKAYHRRLMPASREVIFRMQFHTCAVSEKILAFTRNDLDDACNDMRFPLDGSVELYFTHSPDERPRTVSNVSCDKSPCAIASWNSYENINFTFEQLDEQGVTGVGGVSHTLGPLDGSLYATVTKKRHPPPASPHSPVSPQAPLAHTPSPHGLVNGRYAASIDSGIASSNSAGAAPVSPPTSDTSQTSGESRGTAAAVATGRVGAGGAPPLVDARQLDELLQGMLLDIQSIPDLRPSQTPAPDIDSIRCPDFSMAPKTEARPSLAARTSGDVGLHQYGSHPPHSPVNGYSGSTTHDSLLDTSLSTTAEDLPYHARTDSKPFSYGAVTSSPLLGRRRTASEGGDGAPAPPSPSIHRRNSRETLSQSRAGLESPRLVRRMSGSVGGSPGEGTTGTRRSPSPSPSPEPGSRGGTLQRQRSQTLTTRLISGVDGTPNSTLTRSEHTRSASRLDDSFDFSIDQHSRSFSSTGSNNLSWLQMQQRKLAERREAKFRAERGPQEARMLSELRTRMSQQQQRTTTTSSKEFEDGYVSDTTLMSETSRESSPVKTLPPLTINTGVAPTTPQKPPIGHSTPARGNSAPSSPILPSRSALRERSVRNNPSSSNQRSLPRKYSDTSDKERPFVAVKRAHENFKPNESVDSSTALSQLQTSPHGHINYSSYSSTSTPVDGLLTTVVSSSNQEGLDSLDALSATLASLGSPTHPPTTTTSPPNPISSTTTTITTTAVTTSAESHPILTAQTSQSREDSAWQSDTESSFGGTRPITPGFPPATPTTPYLNQGLPPKSPTMQRKEMGVRSPSPATSQTLRQEVNGHSSPAPSLYHGQSRRSSLTSLNESTEVISSHPKFVKDISKYWYKPTITRDEAITMLKDKAPGTFVVRDSNSFPGAFGLALKVSTPPPNVTTKSSDPASELVRHFLIEPTSRGVRLKGCANEPVFGSLSALVYQHSITALALPCRLMLPERDPAGAPDTVDSGASTSSGGSSTTQLLQQGAACNVMYLHTADTESLTGPQAVKRAVSLMLASKITPTVVHFKVSAQGITLTDNERKLFFRRHYPVNTISHCGLDPDDRRWTHKNEEGAPLGSLRVFGFVAKKGASRTENQCHILAELEPEQPATAICNFVTKVMMTSVSRPNLV